VTSGASDNRVTVREATLALLRSFGLTSVFGNPGSTELPMFRDFPSDFRYVLGLQEAVVVGIADGYAQATRNAALVNLHSAVGVGHAMGNIFTAYKNRTPLVITAGQQARSILPYEPFLFSTQATELPRPYVKWSCEPARAEDVPAAIARAYYTAMQPPCGPTFVSIPVDDWDQLTDPVLPRAVSRSLRPDAVLLDTVGAALEKCSRPVFVVGAAVARDGAWNEVIALAERHQALVWASPMSARNSFPERHRLFAGFLPANRERIVELLGGHDLVVALGSPVFTYHTEGFGPHVPVGAELFQLIDDPDMAAWTPVGTSVVCSLKQGITDLLARPERDVRKRPAAQGRSAAPRVSPETTSSRGGSDITVEYLLQTLSELRPPDSIVVEEAPTARPVMHRYLPFDRADTFFTCASGGLGHSLPAAVGVALARSREGSASGPRIIALMGDGSAMYSIQALWTAAQLGLSLTVVVINNSSYAALNEFARHFNMPGAVGTSLPGIDFTALATAQGGSGVRVTRAADLATALRDAIEGTGVRLVEVVTT